MFAIPGNHDWIDGLETFTSYIQHKVLLLYCMYCVYCTVCTAWYRVACIQHAGWQLVTVKPWVDGTPVPSTSSRM